MPKLNLKATTQSQKVIKEYLEHNASDILADKINNGSLIHKDGKTLVNKKTLDGFMNYAEVYLSGISRSAFHWSSVRETKTEGMSVYFDSSKLFR